MSRAVFAFFLFLLVGPLVGLLTFALLIAAITMDEEPAVGLWFLYASIAFYPLAYLAGGIQAAWTGLITGLAVWRWGRSPLWITLGAALVACAFYVARAHEDAAVSVALVGVHVVPALACWLILRWTE